MNFRTALLALCLITFAFQVNSQCNSSHKEKNNHAKTVSYHHGSDIVDIAASNENFGTLVTAVKTAGLVETLKSSGPFTVFAPTNTAFAKLPEGTVGTLLKPENKEKLTQVLTYHVVAGEFYAKDVINGIKSSGGSFTIETVSGGKLKASLQNETVILEDENGNSIAVLSTDVEATNGVIHVIDSVLLPK